MPAYKVFGSDVAVSDEIDLAVVTDEGDTVDVSVVVSVVCVSMLAPEVVAISEVRLLVLIVCM